MTPTMHHNSIHPDGTRKRRFSTNQAKRAFYARSRSARFARHMGAESVPCRDENPDLFLLLAQLGHSQKLDALLADCDPADTSPVDCGPLWAETESRSAYAWHRLCEASRSPNVLAHVAIALAMFASVLAIGAIHHTQKLSAPIQYHVKPHAPRSVNGVQFIGIDV
jgi:hypothetical protein